MNKFSTPLVKAVIMINLRTKRRYILFLLRLTIIFSIFLGNSSFSFASQYDNEFKIPIYPSAKKIEKYIDNESKVFSKSYSIQTPYPANKIILFYEDEMKKRNFIECKNCHGKSGQWIAFEDISKGTLYFINQYFQEWISEDNERKAFLYLRYEYKQKGAQNDKLYVTFQLMPNYNEKVMTNFLSEMRKAGKYRAFMQLLKKYATADNNVDFEKAIAENPDNIYLKRYKQIVEDITGRK